MVDEKNIIDDDEEEVIFDDDEYYHEIDIKPILENVLKLDIQKDANVYDFFSFDEMDAFISYKGYEVDFSKMSEKERFLYKLCLDELCRKHFDVDRFIDQKAYLCMADIEANPYDTSYEEAVNLLRTCCRDSLSSFCSATTYISLFTYIDDIRNEEVLPYTVAGYLYERKESVCALVESYLNHLDGMIITTEVVKNLIDKVLRECREEYDNGDYSSALPYVCYEKYRIYEVENRKDSYEERKSLLIEAKTAMDKRIDVQKDRYMLIFDKRLLELIVECIECMQ